MRPREARIAAWRTYRCTRPLLLDTTSDGGLARTLSKPMGAAVFTTRALAP
jgi:hypothetical protein